jgi:DNA mismatch repair protein MSH5
MHRTVVRPGIDAQLDEMKRTYDGIGDFLNLTSKTIASTIPVQYSLDLNVIFLPQIGFLICMLMNPATGMAEYEGGEGGGEMWERVFSTEDRVYYKDYRMLELDQAIGDVWSLICGKIYGNYGIGGF